MNRFLGIDYGTVRIGLALSDPSGILASPLPFLENKSPQQISSALTQLALSASACEPAVNTQHIQTGQPTGRAQPCQQCCRVCAVWVILLVQHAP